MINLATTNRTALGRMTINTKGGEKSTITINCSRFESGRLALLAISANGHECKAVSYYWNGKRIHTLYAN